MDEVLSILIATTAMFASLWILGWAYGDFQRKPEPPPPSTQPPGSSST